MKKIISMLLALLLCLGAAALGEGENQMILADKSGAKCTVVIPAKANPRALYTAMAKEITAYIAAKTGAEVSVITDDQAGEGVEILLGDTARDESIKAKAALGKDQLSLQMTESGKIVLAGADDYRLVHAVDLFVADALQSQNGAVVLNESALTTRRLFLSKWEEAASRVSNAMRSTVLKSVKATGKNTALAKISGIRVVMQLTGEQSINRTRSTYNVANADLGSMCLHNGKLYFFFGDTRGGASGTDFLVSNVVAYTTDFDFTDGIRFDGYLTDENGGVLTVTNGSFGTDSAENIQTGHEFTRIPTGAISLNGNLYMSFMSVAHWMGDDWACHYGGIMKSADDGKTWTMLSAKWPGDSKFCQMMPVLNEKDGYVYVVGLTGGRVNPARMMRVRQEEYENFDAYEYLVGYDAAGKALWQTGNEGLYSDFALIPGRVWEPCMMYSKYLDEWIVSHKNAAGIQLYTSKEPFGPYEKAASIPYAHNALAGYYAVYMHPALTSEDGSKIAFLMSAMIPTGLSSGNNWQIQLMEMTLHRE